MPESPQEMIGRLMQGSYQESERDRLNKIRAMKDYERWAEKQGTERSKDDYLMEQDYLRFLQKQQMEGDLDKDVRDYRTRPSAKELIDPQSSPLFRSRGEPSSLKPLVPLDYDEKMNRINRLLENWRKK